MINYKKIGLSTMGNAAYLKDNTLKAVKTAGIDVLEMSFFPVERLHQIGVKAYADTVQKAGLSLWSVHVPFWPFDLAHPDETARADGVRTVKGVLDEIGQAGIRYAVLHAGLEEDYETTRQHRLAQCKCSLKELADYAKPLGVTICVEDLPRDCIGNTISELDELIGVDDSLGIVFDTNHLLQDDPVDFIRHFGNKIETLHVSDYDFIDERHWLPGEGKINWPAVVAALREVGYDGPWLYEISLSAEATIARPTDLTFDDFVQNARMCLNGQTPPPVGIPLV